ncbi:hypothetical protein FACS1894192_03530 [Bacilli bacterium]|nr:hypothetical protein FACS1894192_03530 [Bacilli bacterium]
MKKTVLFALGPVLMSGTLLVNANTADERENVAGMEFTQEKLIGIPRDPKDPSKPFPGKQGALSVYEDDNEQNRSQATEENPKLLSWNEETDFGISHVPARILFGTVTDTEGVAVYRSAGSAAFYEDENFHLQMMDNRDTTSTGWNISVQLQDKVTSASGTHKIDGAMIWFPKGEARNELNPDSTQVDATNFETFSGYATDTTPLEVWRTKGEAKNRGKAVSSLTWAANAVELHIPSNAELLNETYSFSLLWTVEASPEV